MLGGAILIIVVVLFFSIRACSGSNKGNSGDGQKTTSTDQGNVPSSPTSEGESDEKKEDANPMDKHRQEEIPAFSLRQYRLGIKTKTVYVVVGR